MRVIGVDVCACTALLTWLRHDVRGRTVAALFAALFSCRCRRRRVHAVSDSEPVSRAKVLRGKVVCADRFFWTFSCHHPASGRCRYVVSVGRRISSRCASSSLVYIRRVRGREKTLKNVQSCLAATSSQLYPVAVDNDYALWARVARTRTGRALLR